MSIIALYVYSPTTFTTDTTIQPISGEPIAAGEVTLQPGLYRLAAGAQLDAKALARGETYSAIVYDTKTNPPDPPLSPMSGYTMSEIEAFFGGMGEEHNI